MNELKGFWGYGIKEGFACKTISNSKVVYSLRGVVELKEQMLIGYMYEYIIILFDKLTIDQYSLFRRYEMRLAFSYEKDNHYQELISIITELEKLLEE